jgi:hypothetical protein
MNPRTYGARHVPTEGRTTHKVERELERLRLISITEG